MSRIFHAGSGVEFESVRFADLEAGGAKENTFIDRPAPAGIESGGEAEPGARPSEKKKTGAFAAPAVDMEAVREEAYRKGKKEGRREAEAELHTAVQAMAEGLEQVSALRASVLSKSKEDMLRLVMAIARRVIRAEISEKEEVIVKTVEQALSAAVPAEEYYIRVNPEDLRIVRDHEPLFLAAMKGLQNIHCIGDESIARGGCLAESRAGDVDATIDSQLDEIYEHLRKAIG